MQIERITNQQPTGDQPSAIYLASLEDGQKIRTLIMKNPVSGNMDAGFILIDLANSLSYDRVALKRLYLRSKWLKKFLVSVRATATDGKSYMHDAIIGEAALLCGFMKIQTRRVRNLEKRDKIEKLQYQLMELLAKVLKGYNSTLSRQARMDRATADLRLTARIEMLKAMSGAQIKAMEKLYGSYKAQKVMNVLLGIDEKNLEITDGYR